MISEEKITHILHLMMDGLKKSGMIRFTQEEEALREGKKVCLKFIVQMNQVAEIARNRISSQKNPPQEHSPQWENLYQKYFEEELNKIGG